MKSFFESCCLCLIGVVIAVGIMASGVFIYHSIAPHLQVPEKTIAITSGAGSESRTAAQIEYDKREGDIYSGIFCAYLTEHNSDDAKVLAHCVQNYLGARP